MTSNLLKITADILQQARHDEFAGHDPFDGLNSKKFQATPLHKSRLIRLAWLQFHKKSPINFRPLVGIEKQRNPKGVALFILGMLQDYARTNDKSYLTEAQTLGHWLLTQTCDKQIWHHACWGYHFDWQARAFYVPKNTPNVITTVYVARALHALGTTLKNQNFINTAQDAAYFIDKHLYTQSDNHSHYAYIPQQSAYIYNASLWGAAWVATVGNQLNDKSLTQHALTAAEHATQAQNPNGSWVYGTRKHHQFIDGFHTGYNLEALQIIAQNCQTDQFDTPIKHGLNFYKSNLITPNGTAKYYHNSQYPLDTHSFAQALITMCKFNKNQITQKLATQAANTLYIPTRKQFIYQKHRLFTNRINYSRWTQAWAYYALAYYNNHQAEAAVHEDN